MSIAPVFLSLSGVSEDERLFIERGVSQIGRYRIANEEALSFFEGSFVAQQFGISIPPSMMGVQTPVGWGGTVVESLEERLDWQGWHSDEDDFGLSEAYSDNMLDVESGLSHIDSLVFGTTFVMVGSGFEGEPDPLITSHSPLSMTGFWDRRTRRLTGALAVDGVGDGKTVTALRLGETTTYELRNGTWRVVERDQHRLDRIPVVMVPNRIRGSRETGRSEITKPVRYYCEAAARTLLGMEVSREFYNAPKVVGLNIAEDAFQNSDGTPASQWSAVQGRIWTLPPNEEGEPEPDVKQLTAASPTPYLDQIKGYATYVAAEAGIPVTQFGFATDNPPSADAIRAQESRLVKRAERRQTIFGRAWLEVGRLALLIREGQIPDTFNSSITAKWRDAATPTRAAAADEATKLVGAEILTPNSTVTYDRVGLSPAEQRQIEADKRRTAGRAVLNRVAAGPVAPNAPVVG